MQELELKFNQVLKSIQKTVSGVEGCLIVSKEGFPVSSTFAQSQQDIASLAKISAFIMNSGEKALNSTDSGILERMVMAGKDGMLVVKGLDKFFFVAKTSRNTNVGMILMAVKGAEDTIKSFSKSKESKYQRKSLGRSLKKG